MKRFLTSFIFTFVLAMTSIIASVTFSGCTGAPVHLPKDGLYEGDTILFTTERKTSEAFKALDLFVKWEYDNRTLLAPFPEVRKAADYFRANTKQWLQSAYMLRDSYALTRSEADRRELVKVLTILEAALTEASKHVAAHRAAKLPPSTPQ